MNNPFLTTVFMDLNQFSGADRNYAEERWETLAAEHGAVEVESGDYASGGVEVKDQVAVAFETEKTPAVVATFKTAAEAEDFATDVTKDLDGVSYITPNVEVKARVVSIRTPMEPRH